MIKITATLWSESFCEDNMIKSLGKDVITTDFKADFVPMLVRENKNIPSGQNVLWCFEITALSRLSKGGKTLWGFSGHVVFLRNNFLDRKKEKIINFSIDDIHVYGNYCYRHPRFCGDITFIAEKEFFEKLKRDLQ